MSKIDVTMSEKSVSKAYTQLMDKLSEHVNVLAKNGMPFTSIMACKRLFYRYRQQFVNPTTYLSVEIPRNGKIDQEMELLMGDVFDKFNVDVKEVVELGLISTKDLKRILIKYYYKLMHNQGLSYKEIKQNLSKKYGWSISSIEKLIYR